MTIDSLRLGRVLLALAFIAGMSGALAGYGSVRAQVVSLGSDETVEPTVIAQGVAELPDDDVAWRVLRSTGGSRDDQQPVPAVTGFVVAGTDDLLISDLDTSVQTLLGPAEASWVAGDSEQQRASLTDDPVTYSEIGPVPADDADDAGESDVVFAGDAFEGPDGPHRITLSVALLGPDQVLDVTVEDGPVLIYVNAGQLAVSTGGDLATGDAQTYDEDMSLTNDGTDPARVYVAAIGASVPPLPSFAGQATLQVRACPEGSSGFQFTPSQCTPVDAGDGFSVSLLDANYQPVEPSGALEDGEQTWDDLEFGIYPWGAPTLPAPYVGSLWTDIDSNPLDIAQVTIDADTLDVTHILYVFPITEGTISVSIANCPSGVTPDNLAGQTCDAPVGNTTSLTVTTPDGETLDANDATTGSGAYVFTVDVDNASGAFFTVDQASLPAGYDDYLITSGGVNDLNAPLAVSLTSSSPAVSVTIYNFTDEQPSPSPSPSTTPSEAPSVSLDGSVTLQVLSCPSSVSIGNPSAYDQCMSSVGGWSAILVTPSGQTLPASASGGSFTYGDLAPGTYSVGLTALPPGYASAVAPGLSGSGSRVNVSVSADNPSPTVTVLVFQ
ncbi:MAG TPA: hypothetical protein VGT61_09680 [Thermomicrobiales bacterium]|jgi:hypothetical protein|nr:hypothetical protein [Thermomicrobiales bacterium]